MGGPSSSSWTPTKRRGPIAAEFSSPGPASINLSGTIGTSGQSLKHHRSPAFTISSRHYGKNDAAGPGPGTYNVTGISNKGKDEPHASSMHVKPKDPKLYITPAPCDYSPEKAEPKVMDSSPKFSFGVKADPGKPFEGPAPNSYTVPTLMGSCKEGSKHSAPSFTIAGRPKELEEKMKVPGPGSYDEAQVDNYKTLKSPAFSMGQRTNIPSDHTMKPGPGAHCPEKSMVETGPKFTMAARPKEVEDKMKIPGPGTYEVCDLDSFRERLPAFTMSRKSALPKDSLNVPAPNAYSPEKAQMQKTAQFSFGMKHSPYLGKLRDL